jgi:hypothetical protein
MRFYEIRTRLRVRFRSLNSFGLFRTRVVVVAVVVS